MTDAFASDFLKTASEGSDRVLCALSVAEGLTDSLAAELYQFAPITNVHAGSFVRALARSEIAVPRNGEWALSPVVRCEFYRRAAADWELFGKVNNHLLSLGTVSQVSGPELPAYLSTIPGLAYHGVALGKQGALSDYTAPFRGRLSGEQWLSFELASLQQDVGLIPTGALEPTFMQGMILYREGRTKEAIKKLSALAQRDVFRWEIGVAKHLVH